ncbi:MAG: Nif3-like dinuclear metal center hexameric protein [Deltaproteobacteria bacterium HGW-Deltaproteobacteria-15]|nr:MAG: Nif3-like dinuclear metal center hexameric protein [Deltaproteobacteria bacterium HGW-Deltaproteobacteria-15]
MKPTIKDLMSLLNTIAPSNISEEWDNPGLQVGSLTQGIDKIMLSLDPTVEAVREAARKRAQVLLAHHPLLFRPVSCLDLDKFPGNVIHESLSGGVSIIAVHTNLDGAAEGINHILAELLGLGDVEPLQSIPQYPAGGLGRIGFLDEHMAVDVLAEKLKTMLSAEKVRIIGSTDSAARRIAVMGGAGGSMIWKASEMGADVFITGDVTYHQALEAKALGLIVIDAGHFCTERTAFIHFADKLRHLFQQARFAVEVEVYRGERDPFLYK